jgi:hypothetical protein
MSRCPNYQMTAFVFFIFKSAGEGEGWFEGDSTWLIHYKKKHRQVCDNFPRKFHFFLGAIHEKRKFKYFKNLMVKVCKIWCNDVYMSILQCDIFWWQLIDPITKSFWILIIDTVDVQITKWLHLSFLFSNRLGRERGGLRATLLDQFITKKTPKNTDSHSAVLLNSFKFCAIWTSTVSIIRIQKLFVIGN